MSSPAGTTSLNGLINQVQAHGAPSVAGSASSLFGNFSMATLVIGIFAGLVGSAYFLYGKKRSEFPWLFAGLALWVVPLFITSAVWLSLSCGALICAPIVVTRYL